MRADVDANGRPEWCPRCHRMVTVTDQRVEAVGYLDQERELTVTDLDCGHRLEGPLHLPRD